MAPYFASELWAGFQSAPNRINLNCKDFDWNKSVLEQSWPQIDWNYELDLVCKVYIMDITKQCKIFFFVQIHQFFFRQMVWKMQL